MANIQIIRWDDEIIAVNFKENGNPIDLTGYTVFFTVKRWEDTLEDDSEAIIKKTIDTFAFSWDEPEQWLVHIFLTHDDTAIDPTDYKWDIQLKNPEGLISSIDAWSFLVSDDVTKRILPE